VSDEARFRDWVTYIGAIRQESIELFWNRKLFRAVRLMFRTNLELDDRGRHVWEWIAGMYARDAAMLVRRELDKQSGVVNLRHLLHDIEAHPDVLRSHSQALDLPSATDVRRDRESLEAHTGRVREYAERLLAHRTRSAGPDVSFAEVDQAVRAVLQMMRRYYGFLTATDLLAGTPVARFDWLAPFRMPWVVGQFEEPSDDEELEA